MISWSDLWLPPINLWTVPKLERKMSHVLFKLLDKKAICPKRATAGSAGFDLYSLADFRLTPGDYILAPTGISCAIPEGYAGFIWPRSGLAVKHGADILAGLVDADYRGEIMVALINHGDEPIQVEIGQRIAQMVVGPYLGESAVVDELPDPGTRNGGFGSTDEVKV